MLGEGLGGGWRRRTERRGIHTDMNETKFGLIQEMDREGIVG